MSPAGARPGREDLPRQGSRGPLAVGRATWPTELKWIAEGSSAGVAAPWLAVRPVAGAASESPGAASALAALAAVAFADLRPPARRPAPPPIVRFEVVPTDESPYRYAQGRGSRRGRAAVVSRWPAPRVPGVRHGPKDVPVGFARSTSLRRVGPAGDRGGDYPFWSPDSRLHRLLRRRKAEEGRRLGRVRPGALRRGPGRGGTWSREGVILFCALRRKLRSTACPPPAACRRRRSRSTRAHGEDSQRWPHFLPDGRRFLYFSYLGANPGVAQPERRRPGRLARLEGDAGPVVPEASNAIYAATRLRALRVATETCSRSAFDAKSLRRPGEPFPVARGASPSTTPSKFAYFSRPRDRRPGLRPRHDVSLAAPLVRPAGTAGRRGRRTGRLSAPAALVRRTQACARVSRLDRPEHVTSGSTTSTAGSKARLGSDGTSDDGTAVWSPDGSRIAFGSHPRWPSRLFVRAVGGGPEQALLKTTDAEIPVDWSSDGRLIAYVAPDASSNWDLWILPLQGDRKPNPFARRASKMTRFSPDGRRVATVADESGRKRSTSRRSPGPARRRGLRLRRSGRAGDGRPRALLPRARRQKLMAVAIHVGSNGELGASVPPLARRDARRPWPRDFGDYGVRETGSDSSSREDRQPRRCRHVVLNSTAESER